MSQACEVAAALTAVCLLHVPETWCPHCWGWCQCCSSRSGCGDQQSLPHWPTGLVAMDTMPVPGNTQSHLSQVTDKNNYSYMQHYAAGRFVGVYQWKSWNLPNVGWEGNMCNSFPHTCTYCCLNRRGVACHSQCCTPTSVMESVIKITIPESNPDMGL